VTQIFAHRGLHTHERENTVAAFLAAKAQGVDGVELDVRRTVDGALVIHHDPRCEGMAISETRQRELPKYVPTLDEAMESCDGMLVNVEIKNSQDRSETFYDETGELARQVVRHLQQINWVSRVIISSFDQTTCVNARSFDADIGVGWLLWNVDLASAITQAHILGFTAVHPNFRKLDLTAMTLAHEMDLRVNTWTVNSQRALQAMIELDVNAVITDSPARAMTLVSEFSPD
jgi:glycerophosphoryl diester phosphodiesterase